MYLFNHKLNISYLHLFNYKPYIYNDNRNFQHLIRILIQHSLLLNNNFNLSTHDYHFIFCCILDNFIMTEDRPVSINPSGGLCPPLGGVPSLTTPHSRAWRVPAGFLMRRARIPLPALMFINAGGYAPPHIVG